MKTHLILLPLLVLSACAVANGAESLDDRTNAVDAARINARLAIEYMKHGELNVALQKIERALTENSRDASVQMSAGLVFERLRQNDKAADHFREALKLEVDNPEVQNAVGAFMCRNGQAGKGEELFLKAARNPLYQTPEVALTNAGVCARQDGKLGKAEEFLRQAIALPVQYPEALLQLAGVSFERGNYLQARAFLERYTAVAPETPAVMLLGYRVENALGDAGAMNDYASRLRSRYPESAEARSLDVKAGEGQQ